MNAIGVPPEADLSDVADGDFSGMAMPLLVAARDAKQLEDFAFKSGLVCSNVQRLRSGMVVSSYDENKILLLLPGYREDADSAILVDYWVNQLDRYTCEVENLPWQNAAVAGGLALLALAVWGGLIWKFI